MRQLLFFVFLIFYCFIGTENQVKAFNCANNDGSCTWIRPESCKNSQNFCENTAECLVVTKSINSSYSLQMSSTYNQQFQCRCPATTNNCNKYAVPNVVYNCTSHRPANSSVSISNMGGNFLSIFYAEMWSCPMGDDSVIECPSGRTGNEFGCKNVSQLLPNVFALVRFWCQFKNTTCQFDSSLILSHVGQSLANVTSPDNYIFEWRSGVTNKESFQCDNSSQSVFEYDSCYRLTPYNLEWKAARSHCLQLGGDLAQFTNERKFSDILRRLDNSLPKNITISTAIPIWFKWFTWNEGQQRMPQHFLQNANGFQCAVYDFLPEIGFNPLAKCITGTRSKQVRGLCVFPPRISTDNFDYMQISCPAKCGFSGYPDYCWPEAEADTKVSNNCPAELNGMASWTCGINGQWTTPNPDLSYCTNPIVDGSINQANENIEKGEDPGESLNGLTNDIKDIDIPSGNIVQLDQTVKLAIDKQTLLIADTADLNLRDESSKNFTMSVIDLNDVIMNNNVAFWGLDWAARSEAINQVQKNVDDTLYLLTENLVDKVFNYGASFQNIAIQAENKMKTDYNNESYTYVAGDENQLILPAAFAYAVNDTRTRLSFATYGAFQNLLYGDILAQLLEENQTSLEPIGQVVVSKVLGATLGQPNDAIQFADGKVEIHVSTINLDRYQVNETTATCVFWDPSTQDWSSDGCEVLATDGLSTKCQCDHLTNFAVLMDINGVFKNKNNVTTALDYITVIGESISIICLTLALIVFYWVRTLRRDFRFVIHRNLCFNLLIAEVLMLAGIDATANSDLCLSIAVFMHFFFLCAFSWMFVEGLYMYILITKVFDGSGLKQWQYYAIGYALPVLVVAITLGATNTKAYATSPYCWLSYDNGSIWAFAGPLAVIILLNFIFLSMAVSVSLKISRRSVTGRKEKKKNFRWILGTVSLTFVLDITWFFGFLFFGKSTMIFAYIFTILNSLQGLFIFITLCMVNNKVRKDLHRQLITSQRLQRLAIYFKINLSDSQTMPSQNKTGPNGGRHKADFTSSSNGNSQVTELSNRLY